ncbi:molybdopterin molybdenumtransferase MoeA [Altererythrobacter aerius]|uniref:Molybdopterin molybdenumtransferase n=1 Tax=Tsuneonella aeria TaxID=1837929 RepID=A0A6I4TDP4_9SPHN|nr:molybdopterin molybdenumtransferase MoeA [Tsuneonella aeria]
MISLDEALARMLAVALPLDAESVATVDAFDRVLAAPVVAAIDAPRADSSAMDGYAVRRADLSVMPARLVVVGESYAGTAAPPALATGKAVRIFTGAPLPTGADHVVVQENCDRDGDVVTVREAGDGNVRLRAGDFDLGDVLLAAGTRLGAGALVVAAGADLAEVKVVRQPCVVILGTGDELVSPGSARERPGTIPESLSPALAGLVIAAGGKVTRREQLADDLSTLTAIAIRAIEEADLVIVTGGASVGARDFAKPMFGPALDFVFNKVAMKPGKPVWLGRVGGTLVLGLPGNPSSALVTARLFMTPLVAGLAGRDAAGSLVWQTAMLGAELPANGARETLLRARWDGDLLVPLISQDSSSQLMLASAAALIRRPANAPAIGAGAPADYMPF